MTIRHDDIRDLAAGFVLGALSPEEDAAMREHLATCPEPHPELEELGGVVPYLAESLDPVEPPVGLRARILDAAARERLAAPAEARTFDTAPVGPPTPFPSAAERTMRAERRRGVSGWVLGLAAVLAIAVLGAWNFQLQSRLTGIEAELAAARAYQQGVAAVLEVATQPGAQTAFLAETEAGVGGGSGVAAAGPDGTLVISMRDLPATAGSQVYEAWIIVGEAAPVPLGGFQVGVDGTGVFEGSTDLAQPGAALALTLEAAPGATSPSPPVRTIGLLAGADS